MSRFVTTERNLLSTIWAHSKKNVLPILDYAVEHNNSEQSIKYYLDKKLFLLRQFPSNYHSMKLSSINFCHDSFLSIMSEAKKNKCVVLIDAEENDYHKTIQTLTHSMVANGYDKNMYITYQMYRKDGIDTLMSDIRAFQESNMIHNIKLVRGAYLYRDACSEALHLNKRHTDEAYNEAVKYLCKACHGNENQLNVIFATHNQESIQLFRDVVAPNVKHAYLLGMDKDIHLKKTKVQKMVHIPFGPIHKTLPYLGRRYIENNPQLDKFISRMLGDKSDIQKAVTI